MRRTAILTLTALVGAILLCVAAQAALNGAADEALAIVREASQAAGDGRIGDAAALAGRLDEGWERRAHVLELTVSHNALRDISATIAEARIHARFGDADELLCALSAIERRLTRLKDEEALRWENLY